MAREGSQPANLSDGRKATSRGVGNASTDGKWIELSLQGKGPSRWDNDFISIAKRITVLLESNKVHANNYAVATLDDLLGSLYAFVLAMHNEPSFKYRPIGQRIDPHVIVKRARTIVRAHRIRTSGKWMAGFHFNSGLFRLLAVYHRALKIALGQPKGTKHIGDARDPKSLLFQVKDIYKKWTGAEWQNSHIETVRAEVNELKHDTVGKYWGRRVKEACAVAAMGELVDLLEMWELQP